jgi:hypothetical protein
MQTEPIGKMVLDTSSATRLGLHGLDKAQMQLISTYVTSKPVSPCEAALTLLEIEIVKKSSAVYFQDSSPPAMRTTRRRGGAHSAELIIPSIDLWCARPISLEDVGFFDYFRDFTHSTKRPSKKHIAVGNDTFSNQVNSNNCAEIAKTLNYDLRTVCLHGTNKSAG